MKTLKFFRIASVVSQQAHTEELSAIDAFKAFVRLLFDWFAGKYTPKKRNMLIGTLVILYVLSPIDILPGIILDDAVVVIFALKYFKKEISNYVNWEKSNRFKYEVSDAKIVNE